MILAVVLALALVLPPAPTARVNDYAGLLGAGERERLERLMADEERRTGAQMAIAIFRSLEGGSLEDVSIRLAEQWRIGHKGDNGVILVVFVEDRQLRLEVGYGLEGVIPDSVAGAIIRDAIAPRFREGRYAAGLEAAVTAVHARVGSGGAPSAAPPAPVWPFLILVAMLAFLVLMMGLEAHRTRDMVRRGGYTGGRRGWFGPVIMPPPRGGGWRGGGFSGGGGSFGGGGASGRW